MEKSTRVRARVKAHALRQVIEGKEQVAFGVAANILPAMGFAMLGRLVLTKQLVPFYFLGFLLCSYANVPVLGVALIAIIIGIDKYDLLGLGGAQSQLSVEGDEDDDF